MVKRKILASVLSIVLLIGVLAGCSGSNSGKKVSDEKDSSSIATSTATATATPSTNKSKVDVSVAIWGIGDTFKAENPDPVLKSVQDKFGITIKPVSVTWNDYGEKYKIWAATNELPDVIAHEGRGPKDTWKWQSQGVIRPLPTDLSKYPNLDKYMKNEKAKVFLKDGKYWAIPRFQFSDDKYAYGNAIYVWKDMYDSLGLSKQPETWAEFEGMLKALKDKYPGVAPLTSQNLSMMLTVAQNQYALYQDWDKVDGKWQRGFFSNDMPNFISKLKGLWDLGLIDKDWPINKDTSNGADKFVAKKAAAFVSTGYPGHISSVFADKWKKNNPGKSVADNWVMLHTPMSEDGKYYFQQGLFWSESYFSTKVDDEKMDRILQYYDWALSEEGMNATRYGMKGTDFVKKADGIEITREKDSNGNFVDLATKYPSFTSLKSLVFWDEDFPFVDPAGDKAIQKFGNDYLTWKNATTIQHPRYNLFVDTVSTPLKDKFLMNTNEDIIKIIITKGDVKKEWEAAKEKYVKAGYNEMIDEFNKELVKEGIK